MDDENTAAQGEPESSPSWQGPGAWVGPQDWYVGALTPVTDQIFQDGFYPPANHLGNRNVFFCIVKVTPNNQKVVIASGLKRHQLRMVTLDAALAMITETTMRPSVATHAILNENLKHLKL
jgi:hypothetical protein